MLAHPHRRKTATGKVTKNKNELAARIDAKLRSLNLHHGEAEWDPVVLCAVIAAEAYADDDKSLALQAAKEVAAYVRPKLAQVQVEVEVEDSADSAEKRTEKRRLLTEKLGLPIPPELAREIEGYDEGPDETTQVH